MTECWKHSEQALRQEKYRFPCVISAVRTFCTFSDFCRTFSNKPAKRVNLLCSRLHCQALAVVYCTTAVYCNAKHNLGLC